MTTKRYGDIEVELTNEDKLLFPDAGIRKGDLVEYYARIAPRMLPHLEGRPLVLQRFPDGIAGEGFYQKQVGDYFPDWLTTVEVPVQARDDTQELAVCDGPAALAYLANQASITLHPWLSRGDALAHPDLMVIDLDPADDDFDAVRTAAHQVRQLLDELSLPSFPKLTGSSGVHVCVPLDRGDHFDDARALCRQAMDLLAARHPETLTTEQRKDKRGGRLYLDTGRNAYAQTAVAPWSVRALPGAPLAAPIFWRDLQGTQLGPRDYTLRNVFRRIAQRSDPWEGMGEQACSLREARSRLQKMRGEGGSE